METRLGRKTKVDTEGQHDLLRSAAARFRRSSRGQPSSARTSAALARLTVGVTAGSLGRLAYESSMLAQPLDWRSVMAAWATGVVALGLSSATESLVDRKAPPWWQVLVGFCAGLLGQAAWRLLAGGSP
jgi:hypothetical protein